MMMIAVVIKNAGLDVTSVGGGGITGVLILQECQTKRNRGSVQHAPKSRSLVLLSCL